jgi:hypothetical protein
MAGENGVAAAVRLIEATFERKPAPAAAT